MKSLSLSLEEFAARRRKAQTDIEDTIRDEVRLALDLHFNTDGWDQLLDVLKEVYAEAYFQESGERTEPVLPRGVVTQLRSTLRKTKRTLTKPEVLAVSNRLNSLQAPLPIPKGIDPMRVRPQRGKMR